MRHIFLIAMSACLLLAASASAQNESSVDPSTLPMVVISYAFTLGEGAEDRGNAIDGASPLARIYRAIETSLEETHADLPTKLAFVRESYVIQPTVTGSKVVGTHDRSTLYVTAPVHALGDASIVIVSSVSPEATTVFQVDGQLHVKLIYDSMAANKFLSGSSCSPLGQIEGVEISISGKLVLTETNVRWSSKKRRSILLDATAAPAGLRCSLQ